MTHAWRYAVIKSIYPKDVILDVREFYHEVESEVGNPLDMITEGEASPLGESIEIFKECLKMYLLDLTRPVIIFDHEKGRVIGEENPIISLDDLKKILADEAFIGGRIDKSPGPGK